MYNHHVNIACWPLAVLAITSCLLYSIQGRSIEVCGIPMCDPENLCTCSNGIPDRNDPCGGLIHYCSDGGKCKDEEHGCSAENCFEYHINYESEDLPNKITGVDSANDCQDFCQKEKSCNYFTYMIDTKECRLKEMRSQRKNDFKSISGRKYCAKNSEKEQKNNEEETSTCMCSDYMYGSWGNCSKVYGNGPICYVVEPSNCIDKTFSAKTGRYYSWNACREPENPFDNEKKNPLKQVCKKSTIYINPRQVKIPEEVQVISDSCTTKYERKCMNIPYPEYPDVDKDACRNIPVQVCKGKVETKTTYKYETVYEEVEEIKCEPTTSDNK